MKAFAIRLKKVREDNSLTQKETADLLGVPLKTYQKYEAVTLTGHREPNFDTLVRMADLLETTADYLLGRL